MKIIRENNNYIKREPVHEALSAVLAGVGPLPGVPLHPVAVLLRHSNHLPQIVLVETFKEDFENKILYIYIGTVFNVRIFSCYEQFVIRLIRPRSRLRLKASSQSGHGCGFSLECIAACFVRFP